MTVPFKTISGSEWNASDYDRLISLNVTHILNISNEVDNFFSDSFKYLNIRVQDIDSNDLLREFDLTYKFISEAKEQSTACLVHCKMGISRSASVVIAFIMKEMEMNLRNAHGFVKQKRSCINPNKGFMQQLETYESILNAHKSKFNLFEAPSAVAPRKPKQPITTNINRIKSTNDLVGISTTASDSKPLQSDLRRCNSMKFKETPRLNVKRTPSHLKETNKILFDLNETPSNTIVRKLAEDFMKSTPQAAAKILFNEIETSATSVQSGLVRRQIESINIKSRPCTSDDTLQSTDQDSILRKSESLTIQQPLASNRIDHVPMQKSPDSKRFKTESSVTHNESASNKTKKVFEYLADKLKTEDDDENEANSKLIQSEADEQQRSFRFFACNKFIDSNSSNNNCNRSTRRREMSKFHPLTILASKTN